MHSSGTGAAPHYAAPSMHSFDQTVVQFAAAPAASTVAAAAAALSRSPRKRSSASMLDDPTPIATPFSSPASASPHRPRALIQVHQASSMEVRSRGSRDAAAAAVSNGFALSASSSSSAAPHVPSSRLFTTTRIVQLSDAAPSKRRRASSASAGGRRTLAAVSAATAQPRLTTHGSKRKGRASDDADDDDDQVEHRDGIEPAIESSAQRLNGHRWVSEAYGKKRSKIDGQANTAAAPPPPQPASDREPEEHREAENEQPAAAVPVEDVQVAATAAAAASAEASSDDSMLSALSISSASSSRSSSPTIASAVSVEFSSTTDEHSHEQHLPPCPLSRSGECCPTADLLRRQNQHLKFLLQEEKGLRQKAEQRVALLEHQQRRANGSGGGAAPAAVSFVSGPLSPAQNLYGTASGIRHSSSGDSDYLSPATHAAVAASSAHASIPSRGSFLPSSVPFNWMLDRPPQRFVPFFFPNGLPLSSFSSGSCGAGDFGPL